MSLIQEALRRQQEEFGDGSQKTKPAADAAAPANVPSAAPASAAPENKTSARLSMPFPEPPAAAPVAAVEAAAPRVRSWPALVGIAVAFLIFCGAIGFLVVFGLRYFKAKPAAAPAPEPRPAAPVSVPGKIIATAADNFKNAKALYTDTATGEVKGAPETKPAPAPEKAPAPAAVEKKPEPVSPPPEEKPKPVSDKLPEPRKQAAADKKIPAPTVKWPTLNLTGVLCSPVPGEGAARLNGKMIFVGQQIDGVTVVKIQEDGVLLRNEGEVRFLRVGATLY